MYNSNILLIQFNPFTAYNYNKPRKHGGQQQHITSSLSNTLTDILHFETDQLSNWMLEPKLDPKIWSN